MEFATFESGTHLQIFYIDRIDALIIYLHDVKERWVLYNCREDDGIDIMGTAVWLAYCN